MKHYGPQVDFNNMWNRLMDRMEARSLKKAKAEARVNRPPRKRKRRKVSVGGKVFAGTISSTRQSRNAKAGLLKRRYGG